MRDGQARGRLLGYGWDDDLDRLRLAGCVRLWTASNDEQLDLLLADAAAGDTLTVIALDRLGLPRDDVIELVADLRATDIGLRSLNDDVDTSAGHAGPIAARVFSALQGVPRTRPRSTGRGRPVAINPLKLKAARAMLETIDERTGRRHSVAAVAARLGVSRSALYRALG